MRKERPRMKCKKRKAKGYWVQSLYAVVEPNGMAYDYLHNKKDAIKVAKELNTPINGDEEL